MLISQWGLWRKYVRRSTRDKNDASALETLAISSNFAAVSVLVRHFRCSDVIVAQVRDHAGEPLGDSTLEQATFECATKNTGRDSWPGLMTNFVLSIMETDVERLGVPLGIIVGGQFRGDELSVSVDGTIDVESAAF